MQSDAVDQHILMERLHQVLFIHRADAHIDHDHIEQIQRNAADRGHRERLQQTASEICRTTGTEAHEPVQQQDDHKHEDAGKNRAFLRDRIVIVKVFLLTDAKVAAIFHDMLLRS